ncbi:MAG: hypothetical protein ACKV0T_07740 [Planctomycetales bacterium]
MHAQLGAVVLLAALSGGTRETTVYDDYRQAYLAARAAKLPVLVILNPGAQEEQSAVDLDTLRRTAQRRSLLGNYVVAVIDVSTPDGKKVHELFNSPPLPRVSVLDRHQKWQIYRTSKLLSPEDWNLLLDRHQKGEPPVIAPPQGQCLT